MQSQDFYSRDFHPRNSGLFLVSGFLSPGFGIFYNFWIFIPGIFAKSPGTGIFSGFFSFGIFFVVWDIPTKSQLCFYSTSYSRDLIPGIRNFLDFWDSEVVIKTITQKRGSRREGPTPTRHSSGSCSKSSFKSYQRRK